MLFKLLSILSLVMARVSCNPLRASLAWALRKPDFLRSCVAYFSVDRFIIGDSIDARG